MIVLDQWQKDFIACKEDKILVAGRQTGKSEAQAFDNCEFAATHPGTTTLIISKTERQAEELLIKTLNYAQHFYPTRIGKGKLKPLKSTIWITHKGEKPSRVMSLPIGLAAEGIRGYTIHKLSVDEAQLPPDAVYNAVMPMLLTTGGKISLTGTPQGKKGFFWKAYENKTGAWKVFHINSEEVINNRPISESWQEWKKQEGINFLKKEKERMSAKHYAQEYLGQFVEDLEQFFSDEWIAKVCQANPIIRDNGKYAIGVDVGRVQDPSTFQILDGTDRDNIIHVESIVKKDYPITRTAEEIIELDKKYNFKEGIGIDGGGMGAGVIDILLLDTKIASKVRDLNNSRRSIDSEKGKTRLLKEDMYRNLLALGEQGKIKLLKDDEVKNSLKSCQIEYKEGTNRPIIFGNDTHIAEGIIRAAYLLRKKSLNLFATYSNDGKPVF